MSNVSKVRTLAPHLHAEGRMRDIQMAALDWIYRFGSTTRDFLTQDLFNPQESRGLDRTLFTQGWVRGIPCGIHSEKSGKEAPGAILVLTEKGLELARKRYAEPWEYPELHWETCNDLRVNERIWSQQLTAMNYRQGGMRKFWTRRMLPDDDYPYPDMEWIMEDGRLLAITVDTGDYFPARHLSCVALCDRESRERRYDREVLIADDYGIVKDYHDRLKPGERLPIWEDDPEDFTPVGEVLVPDLTRRMIVFLADPWGEVLVS
ncbi:hypothetical protein B1757_02520 [Acidithiobacillus marinus]|uniref:Uncharacterized protein n=1 Tax=Acidithiobacillus marinus TaxID=187490 RepID=A0A2I1DPP9_9PROT|nr:hypothetical protein [Acidithiobacillus marinus]PKY11853.1 hypothetical protein B1757_02520 [Acidithiobacillus marinus]